MVIINSPIDSGTQYMSKTDIGKDSHKKFGSDQKSIFNGSN